MVSFFARYARKAAAVLARADICRATDSEQRCCELSVVSQRIGEGKLPLSAFGRKKKARIKR